MFKWYNPFSWFFGVRIIHHRISFPYDDIHSKNKAISRPLKFPNYAIDPTVTPDYFYGQRDISKNDKKQ